MTAFPSRPTGSQRLGSPPGLAGQSATCLLLAALIAAGMICVPSPSPASAQSPEVTPQTPDTPWYDSETGRLRPVTVKESVQDAENRNSRWRPKPKKIRRVTNTGGRGGGGGFGTGAGSLGNVLGWTMMGLGAALVIGMLIYFFSQADPEIAVGQRRGKAGNSEFSEEELAERMEQLPVEVRQQGTDMRGEAERSMRTGDLERAIIFLFGHQLLQLDRHQMLRLARGKTNRTYIREANGHGRPGDILAETVDTFEASYFGRHLIAPERFQYLWDQNGQLEQLLRQTREAAV